MKHHNMIIRGGACKILTNKFLKKCDVFYIIIAAALHWPLLGLLNENVLYYRQFFLSSNLGKNIRTYITYLLRSLNCPKEIAIVKIKY